VAGDADVIVVRIELWSAVTGQVTELARMQISNDGTGSDTHGSYDGVTFRGRSKDALDKGTASKRGRVANFPRRSAHVWNLVARMLKTMGYA
jgi:hypothetical protein